MKQPASMLIAAVILGFFLLSTSLANMDTIVFGIGVAFLFLILSRWLRLL